MTVFVSRQGKVTVAQGPQTKDVLLFSPVLKSSSEILQEQRASWKKNIERIKQGYQAANKREKQ